MKVLTPTGQETHSAELSDDLILQVDVQPSNVYGGFVRSCHAESPTRKDEDYYDITDAYGCATDPTIFGKWEYNQSTRFLTAKFNAFKFANSDDITFQCTVRTCLGQCQPVNCGRGGNDAFGRRRKRQISDEINCSTAIRVSYKTKRN
ncbi:uncharacterized protein LOC135833754 [Planococcus citri]|uniref:uncharacterized protein LOC135833754 n=1 Tax=Planococcus citri TaxID=170843 RepID=UPI0031F86873